MAKNAMHCVAWPDGNDQCEYVPSASGAGGLGRSVIRLKML